jgi:Amt family ammonium transporter
LLDRLHGADRPGSSRAAASSSISAHSSEPGRRRGQIGNGAIAALVAIKAVFGLRMTPQEEEAGLDIVEHGMYGYPEQYVDAIDLEPLGVPRG